MDRSKNVIKNDISIGSPSNQPNLSIIIRTGIITGSVTEYKNTTIGFPSSIGNQLMIALAIIKN